ncbi:peptidyl-prolyl cis-trans isomerase [Synechococcus sp. MU1617]|nr:peptidyl-prolyl cis-trans isomerase [Synechococcus sp. MU1617]
MLKEWAFGDLKENFSKIDPFHLNCLKLSSSFDAFLSFWIKYNLACKIHSFQKDNSESSDNAQFLFHNIDLMSRIDDYDQLRTQINSSIDSVIYDWAVMEWSSRLEALYISNKSSLDSYSFELLRNSDQLMAAEIYYRLVSDEQPFESLSWSFGQGAEKKHGGKFENMKAKDIPISIIQILKTLNTGQVAKPRKLGGLYTIVRLNKFQDAKFDDLTKKEILEFQIDEFLISLKESLLSTL